MTIVRNIVKSLLPRRFHPIRFSLARLARASRERQAILGPHATAVLTEGYNGKLLVTAADMEVGRLLAFNGSYNQPEIEFHLSNLNADSRVLFVETHVGSLLVPIAKRVRQVVGIEANPRTFALLEMNIQLNSLHNVEIYHLAAGDRDGEIEFLMHSQNTGASKIKHGNVDEHDPILGYDHPELARVNMKRLDDCISSRSFDLIVMDIEGAEYLALQGMVDILRHSQSLQLEIVPFLVHEVSQVQPGQVLDLLRPHFQRARRLADAMEGKAARPFDAFAADLAENKQLVDLYFEKDPMPV
jgi:FkbM family methyltransferase